MGENWRVYIMLQRSAELSEYKHVAIASQQVQDKSKSRKLVTQSTLVGISLFLLKFIINDDAKYSLRALAKEIISEQEHSTEPTEWILSIDILEDYKKIEDKNEQEINKAMICIANVSQLINLHQSTNQLNIKYPTMMKCYQEVFLPACQQYINVKEQEYTYLSYLAKSDQRKAISVVGSCSLFAQDKAKGLNNISQDGNENVDLSQYDIRWPYKG
jgi:hypothetical protein